MSIWTQIKPPAAQYIRLAGRVLKVSVYVSVGTPRDDGTTPAFNAWCEKSFATFLAQCNDNDEESSPLVVRVQAHWHDQTGTDIQHATIRTFDRDAVVEDAADTIRRYAMVDAALSDLKDRILKGSSKFASLNTDYSEGR